MSTGIEDQREYEENANEVFECFINSMIGNRRFVIPVDEYEGPVEDHWTYVFTGRGMRLCERMKDRLYQLARLKFGEDAAFDMEISSHLCQEL